MNVFHLIGDKLLHGVGSFFAMDFGTNALRLVELSGNAQDGWKLEKYAYMPVEAKVMSDDSDAGRRRIGEAIKEAVKRAGIKTKNIAIGLPARKTYTAIIEVDRAPADELRKTLRFQLDQYIPMAVDEAKVDYVILGPNPNNPKKTEVLVSSTAKKYAEERMEMLEGLGFNVIAQEPEPIAMTRALMPIGATDAQMIVDLGEKSTDLVVAYHNAPRLVRTIPGGLSLLVRTVSNNLRVREDQAREFILRYGLVQDQLDGQVFQALDTVLDNYTQELTKSVKFFQSNYTNAKVGGIILSGFAGVIPFLAEYVEVKTGVSTVQGNPWQLVRVTPEQQQSLINVASEYAVAIGLAERSND